ncbi:MAG: divergent PAP2 family protein [Patescibacteria group bacterium]
MTIPALLASPIVWSTFFAMFTAQCIKSLLSWKQDGHFHWRYIFLTAGMPSSHTAVVTALSTSLYLSEGPTHLFIVAGTLSLIVIRDVIGDKAFAQAQENIVNKIFDRITHGQYEAARWNTLIGHTLKEVVAGFLLGIAVALAVFRLF